MKSGVAGGIQHCIEVIIGGAALLAKEGLADVEPWAFADSVTARVRSDIDKTWRGELPRVHFYDNEGQRTVHIGVVLTADMQKWLGES